MKSIIIISSIVILLLIITLIFTFKVINETRFANVERDLVFKRIKRVIDEIDYKEQQYNEAKTEDRWQYQTDYKQVYNNIKEWLLTK